MVTTVSNLQVVKPISTGSLQPSTIGNSVSSVQPEGLEGFYVYTGTAEEDLYLEKITSNKQMLRATRLTSCSSETINQIIKNAKIKRENEKIDLAEYYKEQGLSTTNIEKIEKLIDHIIDIKDINEIAKYFDCTIEKNRFGIVVLGVKLHHDDKTKAALEPTLKFNFQIIDRSNVNNEEKISVSFLPDQEDYLTEAGKLDNLTTGVKVTTDDNSFVKAGGCFDMNYNILNIDFNNKEGSRLSLTSNTECNLGLSLNFPKLPNLFSFNADVKEDIEFTLKPNDGSNRTPDIGLFSLGTQVQMKSYVSKESDVDIRTQGYFKYTTPNLSNVIDVTTKLAFKAGAESTNLLNKKVNVKPLLGTSIYYKNSNYASIEFFVEVAPAVKKEETTQWQAGLKCALKLNEK